MKIIETDPKLKNFLHLKKLSKGRLKQYNTTFTELETITNKTPSQLLKIMENEQQPYLNKKGEPRIRPMHDRMIYSLQIEYDIYLENKKNSERTKDEKQKTMRTFFSEHGIEIPKKIKYDTKTKRTREEDIPTWDEVRESIDYCKSQRDKAIVLLIATSGIRESDLVQLTVKDLLKAIQIYNIKTIEEFINNKEDIIPCYDFEPKKTEKDGNLCITFNSHECSDYLKKYLKERAEKDKNLNLNSPLFQSKRTKGFLNTDSINKIFQKLNEKLKAGKDKNGVYGKFRPHNLRKLFSTTCRKNITNIVSNKDKTTELDIISIFTGHTPPNANNSDVYDAVSSDSFDNYLRTTYMGLLPFLSIGEVEIHHMDTEATKELKKELAKTKEDLKAKNDIICRMDERLTRLEEADNRPIK